MSFLLSVLEQGLIYGIVSLGVYITFKILDFPDMSVDGSFPLGAGVSALCLTHGVNPYLTLIIAFAAGAVGGLLTSFLHIKLKITNLLSGILVMLALYSLSLRIMGKPNISLYGNDTIFSNGIDPLFIIAIFVIVCKVLLDLFFKTKLGFILISSGDNPQLVTSLGVNKGFIITIGLMISNGLVALGGSLMAQQQGFADIQMGAGTIIVGLAAIIVGTSIFKKVNVLAVTTITIIGSIIYKLILGIAMSLDFVESYDMKLITALIVAIALALSNMKLKFKKKNEIIGGDSSVRTTKSA